ncbi:MAG: AraC family transcriptional regulator [Rhodococcus sp. (in: high G+C Gram-positive bacteria)]|uniref:AraC family transcriptional regulator n=1 Tax=Rhodococcus sp. TaxID=1831 RepID=UPI002ADC9AA5|nr:AraC family transcriptional regulator [Rhodococcus sp. (in: high G+C Gram-positive bacteria)]
MVHLIRGTILLDVPTLIEGLGGDPEAFMTAHGITASTAGDFSKFVPYNSAAAVIGDASRALECPDFGLQLSVLQHTRMLGPVAVIVRNSETVGAAVSSASRYLHGIAPADSVSMTTVGDVAVISFETDVRRTADRRQMVERGVGTLFAAFTLMVGPGFVPIRVTFTHDQIAPIERYHSVFRCPVEFGKSVDAIHVPASVLTRPISGRDPAALELAENYLSSTTAEEPVTDTVRSLVRRLMVVDHVTLSAVADSLSLHPRVVQRRLAEAGTSFEAIFDEIRRETAWELSAVGLPISRIAAALGYSEQSSYSRACRRWFGESPRALRNRARAQDGERMTL